MLLTHLEISDNKDFLSRRFIAQKLQRLLKWNSRAKMNFFDETNGLLGLNLTTSVFCQEVLKTFQHLSPSDFLCFYKHAINAPHFTSLLKIF